MAQIDASIPLQIQQFKQTGPLEQYAQLEQLKGLRDQGLLRNAQMQEFQDKRLRAQGVRDIASSGLQGEELANALQAKGYLDEATTYRKNMSEAEAAKITRAKSIVELQGSLAKAVLSNPTEAAAIAAIEHMERVTGQKDDNERAAVYALRGDPTAIMKWAGGHALSAEQQLPKFQHFDQGGTIGMGVTSPYGEYTPTSTITKTATPGEVMTDARTRQEGAANRAVTVRGQDMTDTRARELATLTREQGKAADWQYDATNGLLVNKLTGQTKPIVGANGSMPKLTEFQGKSFAFGNRAIEADNIINTVGANYSPTALATKQGLGNVWGVGSALEMGANTMLSKNDQRVEQAQRDFINAVLRQESGAAIGKDEFANARKQYFPQPGDSAEVVAQKAANRQRAIQGFKVSAGPAGELIKPSEKPGEQSGASGSWAAGDYVETRVANPPDPAKVPVGSEFDQGGVTYINDGKKWNRKK